LGGTAELANSRIRQLFLSNETFSKVKALTENATKNSIEKLWNNVREYFSPSNLAREKTSSKICFTI
jgi:hypothetical protein